MLASDSRRESGATTSAGAVAILSGKDHLPGTTVNRYWLLQPRNCCSLNDGAAAAVIMSDTKAKQLGITPLARIVATGPSGHRPEIMGGGPVESSERVLDRAGLTNADIDLVEIDEGFAAQVIPSVRELVDEEELNISGGAIAVGHPFGMTGARITSTLIMLPAPPRQAARPGDDVRRRRTGMALILERLTSSWGRPCKNSPPLGARRSRSAPPRAPDSRPGSTPKTYGVVISACGIDATSLIKRGDRPFMPSHRDACSICMEAVAWSAHGGTVPWGA
jgi:hypothetical protein